jgi:hypothetical protein
MYEWDVDGDTDFDEHVTGAMPELSAMQMAALGLNDGPDTRSVTVVVSDGTNSNTASATLTINNVAPVIDNLSATSADENGIVTLTGTYHDVGTRDTHTIDINWGPGEMPSLGVVVTGGTFSISHQHLDDNPTGTSSDVYAVSVTLTDDDTASDSDTTTTTVANKAPAVDSLTVSSAVINEDGSVTIMGSFTDAGTQDTHTVMIDWGTGETPSAAMVTQDAGSGTFMATHQYLDDNPTGTLSDLYEITVTVTDDDGSSASARVDVTVNNVAPSVGVITAPVAPNAAGIVIHASASFTEQGTADTHTAIWNWGDGNTSSGVVSESGGSGSVTGSHAYDSAGVYTVTLTVTDDDGGSGQSVFQYVVVYDPSAGFVTGGGWIISPAGAYVPDATLTGKATFGFVSKSHTGSNIPTGQTEFQFKSGNLKFHSTSYERLVVAGARAHYNGVGKINGAGNYGFMLTAIDGQASGGGGVDKFRVKIWDKNNNNAVVYDNQIGGSDDAAPTTMLGGGQIVIHTNGSNLNGTSIGTTLNGAMLTQPMLESAVAEAISHWGTAGVSQQRLAEISHFDIGLANFSGAILGLASSSTNKIWLDVDAAGLGWSTNVIGGGYDLVSAVRHEIGHALGFDHDVMGELLEPGDIHLSGDHFEAVGELPGLHQHFGRASSALDSVFDSFGSSGRGLHRQSRPTNVRNDFSVSYNEQNVDQLHNDRSFSFDSRFGRDDVRDEDVESPGDVSDEPLGAKSKGSIGVANASRSRGIVYRS